MFTVIFQDKLQHSVPILDFNGSMDDGGGSDNWSCKLYV